MHSLTQNWEDGKWYLHCKEVVLHRVIYPKVHANGSQKKKKSSKPFNPWASGTNDEWGDLANLLRHRD